MFDRDGSMSTRCVVCGEAGHASKDCTCPGGGKDERRDVHLRAYQRRKPEAEMDSAKGGKGKKGKGKGKYGTTTNTTAGQRPTTQWGLKPTAKAVTNDPDEQFPRGAAGLDSWANVWLQYRPTQCAGTKLTK